MSSSILMYGREDRSFWAPSAMEPAGDASLRKPTSLSPFCNAQRLAVDCQPVILACIATLFLVVSPFTISWFVALVVINSVYRSVFRARTHIGKKSFKRAPAITDSYAASAVSVESRTVRIQASRHDSRPHFVFWCPDLAPSSSVRDDRITARASATLSVTAPQVPYRRIVSVAAVALTHPHDGAAASALSGAFRDQAAELLAGYIKSLAPRKFTRKFGRDLANQTSAAFLMTGTQRIADGGGCVSAVAEAFPGNSFALAQLDASNSRNDSQATETFTNEIKNGWHARTLTQTRLDCFPRLSLDDALAEVPA